MIYQRMDKRVAEGDILLLEGNFNDGPQIQLHKVAQVKITEQDGFEVILKKKGNIYFNMDTYLEGNSWVKEGYIICEGKLTTAPAPVTGNA